ncbi:hypothetical protein [Chamaesiphon polymorphus]|uniref:hypothetical protein n=1 Tax=Chamaesiphon polymorphus TaxID=2107691 RepID=UPI0015E694EB|nr:hypothetical protein [Chamaesiphon polymorphus]
MLVQNISSDRRTLEPFGLDEPYYQVTVTDFSTAAWLVYPLRTDVPIEVRRFFKFLEI